MSNLISKFSPSFSENNDGKTTSGKNTLFVENSALPSDNQIEYEETNTISNSVKCPSAKFDNDTVVSSDKSDFKLEGNINGTIGGDPIKKSKLARHVANSHDQANSMPFSSMAIEQCEIDRLLELSSYRRKSKSRWQFSPSIKGTDQIPIAVETSALSTINPSLCPANHQNEQKSNHDLNEEAAIDTCPTEDMSPSNGGSKHTSQGSTNRDLTVTNQKFPNAHITTQINSQMSRPQKHRYDHEHQKQQQHDQQSNQHFDNALSQSERIAHYKDERRQNRHYVSKNLGVTLSSDFAESGQPSSPSQCPPATVSDCSPSPEFPPASKARPNVIKAANPSASIWSWRKVHNSPASSTSSSKPFSRDKSQSLATSVSFDNSYGSIMHHNTNEDSVEIPVHMCTLVELNDTTLIVANRRESLTQSLKHSLIEKSPRQARDKESREISPKRRLTRSLINNSHEETFQTNNRRSGSIILTDADVDRKLLDTSSLSNHQQTDPFLQDVERSFEAINCSPIRYPAPFSRSDHRHVVNCVNQSSNVTENLDLHPCSSNGQTSQKNRVDLHTRVSNKSPKSNDQACTIRQGCLKCGRNSYSSALGNNSSVTKLSPRPLQGASAKQQQHDLPITAFEPSQVSPPASPQDHRVHRTSYRSSKMVTGKPSKANSKVAVEARMDATAKVATNDSKPTSRPLCHGFKSFTEMHKNKAKPCVPQGIYATTWFPRSGHSPKHVDKFANENMYSKNHSPRDNNATALGSDKARTKSRKSRMYEHTPNIPSDNIASPCSEMDDDYVEILSSDYRSDLSDSTSGYLQLNAKSKKTLKQPEYSSVGEENITTVSIVSDIKGSDASCSKDSPISSRPVYRGNAHGSIAFETKSCTHGFKEKRLSLSSCLPIDKNAKLQPTHIVTKRASVSEGVLPESMIGLSRADKRELLKRQHEEAIAKFQLYVGMRKSSEGNVVVSTDQEFGKNDVPGPSYIRHKEKTVHNTSPLLSAGSSKYTYSSSEISHASSSSQESNESRDHSHRHGVQSPSNQCHGCSHIVTVSPGCTNLKGFSKTKRKRGTISRNEDCREEESKSSSPIPNVRVVDFQPMVCVPFSSIVSNIPPDSTGHEELKQNTAQSVSSAPNSLYSSDNEYHQFKLQTTNNEDVDAEEDNEESAETETVRTTKTTSSLQAMRDSRKDNTLKGQESKRKENLLHNSGVNRKFDVEHPANVTPKEKILTRLSSPPRTKTHYSNKTSSFNSLRRISPLSGSFRDAHKYFEKRERKELLLSSPPRSPIMKTSTPVNASQIVIQNQTRHSVVDSIIKENEDSTSSVTEDVDTSCVSINKATEHDEGVKKNKEPNDVTTASALIHKRVAKFVGSKTSSKSHCHSDNNPSSTCALGNISWDAVKINKSSLDEQIPCSGLIDTPPVKWSLCDAPQMSALTHWPQKSSPGEAYQKLSLIEGSQNSCSDTPHMSIIADDSSQRLNLNDGKCNSCLDDVSGDRKGGCVQGKSSNDTPVTYISVAKNDDNSKGTINGDYDDDDNYKEAFVKEDEEIRMEIKSHDTSQSQLKLASHDERLESTEAINMIENVSNYQNENRKDAGKDSWLPKRPNKESSQEKSTLSNSSFNDKPSHLQNKSDIMSGHNKYILNSSQPKGLPPHCPAVRHTSATHNAEIPNSPVRSNESITREKAFTCGIVPKSNFLQSRNNGSNISSHIDDNKGGQLSIPDGNPCRSITDYSKNISSPLLGAHVSVDLRDKDVEENDGKRNNFENNEAINEHAIKIQTSDKMAKSQIPLSSGSMTWDNKSDRDDSQRPQNKLSDMFAKNYQEKHAIEQLIVEDDTLNSCTELIDSEAVELGKERISICHDGACSPQDRLPAHHQVNNIQRNKSEEKQNVQKCFIHNSVLPLDQMRNSTHVGPVRAIHDPPKTFTSPRQDTSSCFFDKNLIPLSNNFGNANNLMTHSKHIDYHQNTAGNTQRIELLSERGHFSLTNMTDKPHNSEIKNVTVTNSVSSSSVPSQNISTGVGLKSNRTPRTPRTSRTRTPRQQNLKQRSDRMESPRVQTNVTQSKKGKRVGSKIADKIKRFLNIKKGTSLNEVASHGATMSKQIFPAFGIDYSRAPTKTISSKSVKSDTDQDSSFISMNNLPEQFTESFVVQNNNITSRPKSKNIERESGNVSLASKSTSTCDIIGDNLRKVKNSEIIACRQYESTVTSKDETPRTQKVEVIAKLGTKEIETGVEMVNQHVQVVTSPEIPFISHDKKEENQYKVQSDINSVTPKHRNQGRNLNSGDEFLSSRNRGVSYSEVYEISTETQGVHSYGKQMYLRTLNTSGSPDVPEISQRLPADETAFKSLKSNMLIVQKSPNQSAHETKTTVTKPNGVKEIAPTTQPTQAQRSVRGFPEQTIKIPNNLKGPETTNQIISESSVLADWAYSLSTTDKQDKDLPLSRTSPNDVPDRKDEIVAISTKETTSNSCSKFQAVLSSQDQRGAEESRRTRTGQNSLESQYSALDLSDDSFNSLFLENVMYLDPKLSSLPCSEQGKGGKVSTDMFTSGISVSKSESKTREKRTSSQKSSPSLR